MEVVLDFIKRRAKVVKIRIPKGIADAILRECLTEWSVVGTDSPGFEIQSVIPFSPILEKIDFFHEWVHPWLDSPIMFRVRAKINGSVFRKVDFSFRCPGSCEFPEFMMISMCKGKVSWCFQSDALDRVMGGEIQA
jgi:hypothetical protein